MALASPRARTTLWGGRAAELTESRKRPRVDAPSWGERAVPPLQRAPRDGWQHLESYILAQPLAGDMQPPARTRQQQPRH